MDNETIVAQAIQALNQVLKNDKIISTNLAVDNDWNDGVRSINIEVKYYPSKEA